MTDTAVAPPAMPAGSWPAPGATATDSTPTSAAASPRPSRRSIGVTRARIIILGVAYVAVGVVGCAIFDDAQVGVILAPVVPTIAALATLRRGPWTRMLAAIAALGASTLIAVMLADGSPSDVREALSSGFRGLLSTEWPSPARPELVGTVAATIAAAVALSAELARRPRFHLLPLLPLVVITVGAIALSAPGGTAWLPLAVVGLCAVAIALLRNDGSLHDRLVLLRGERRIVPLLALAAVIALLSSVTMTLPDRADPRQDDPPRRAAAILDPIEATLALRDLDPPIDLHEITSGGGDPLPGRWRTTALENYNGDRWTPELVVRPIGTTLGVATGPTIEADISFLSDALSLVPLPGPPITVDAAVETDVDRTIVRLVDRPEVGDVVRIEAEVTTSQAVAREVGVATRVIDDDVAALAALAESMAGTGTPVDQLAALETAMRDGDFVLDNGVQGGGLQRVFVDIFLRDTQRGNLEQFVTGFVLLARSLGIDARVATGFITDAPVDSDGALTLRSADATVWPEVKLQDGSWVAYDPIPAEEATDTAPPPEQPQTQTPAAPQPPVDPPPEPDEQPPQEEDPTESETDGRLSAALIWAMRVTGGLVVLSAPFLIAAALILGAKFRRRRARRRADAAIDRIRGAWASATDSLVDAGLTIPESSTDAEIAGAGEPLAFDARKDLRRLSSLSSTATFGRLNQEDFLADDAARCLHHVEESMASNRTLRQRLAWRLSLRSLRRSTRSPVR